MSWTTLNFSFPFANSSYTKFSVKFTSWTSRILNTDKQWLLDKNLWIFMHLLLFHDFFCENWENWFSWILLSTENSLTFDQLCFVQQKVLSFQYQLSCVSGLLHFVALWSGACFEVFMLIAVQAVVITSSPCSTSFSKLLNVLNSVTSNQIVKRNMAWRSHGSTNEELVTKLRG